MVADPTNEPKLTDEPWLSIARSQASKPCGPVNSLRTFGGVGLVGLDEGDRAVVGGGVGPAFAHDLGRDTLRDLADDPAIASEQGLAGVALDVDESGADDQPLGIDPLLRRRVFQYSRRRDPRDPAVFECDVAVEPGVAGAVDHPAAEDHDVEGTGRSGRDFTARSHLRGRTLGRHCGLAVGSDKCGDEQQYDAMTSSVAANSHQYPGSNMGIKRPHGCRRFVP